MLIRDVMTVNPACCKPEDKLDAVARLMLNQNCGEIPVCDGTKLVGVVTDRDITCRAVARGKDPAVVPAGDVMTRDVHTITPDNELEDAIDLMEETLVGRLPVIDDAGRIVGIVTQADVAANASMLKVRRAMKTVARNRRKQRTAIL